MKRFIAVLLTIVMLIIPVKASKKNYPTAEYVWDYLQEQGYNDYVCAGIIGNMMVEVGGGTLDLKPSLIGNKRYYGICQWNKKYYPEVWQLSLKYQCKFLGSTIKDEFNMFGSLYKRNFGYNDFIKLTNTKQAALAFARVYERCGAGSYSDRQKCAALAYEYFCPRR